MVDVSQVLATGGTTIVGVVLGAGLAYWFGALNRRHQEAREDATRWYEKRLQAYIDFYTDANEVFFATHGKQTTRRDRLPLMRKLHSDATAIDFLGSPDVIGETWSVYDATFEEWEKSEPFPEGPVSLSAFLGACRKDLGHPLPPGGKHTATKPRASARRFAT